jgi:hypothetical protein
VWKDACSNARIRRFSRIQARAWLTWLQAQRQATGLSLTLPKLFEQVGVIFLAC